VLLDRLQPYNKKRPRVCTRSPFKSNLKVLQEQQTQLHSTTILDLRLAISTGRLDEISKTLRPFETNEGAATRKFKGAS
jgi:hypothetical protein